MSARGLTWIEDPSNLDGKFARIRLRRLAPAMAAEGLTAARLADTAANLGRARAAVDASVAKRLARHGFLHPGGVLHLTPGAFDGLAEETGLRLLARAVTAIGGRRYGPRLARLEGLYGRLQQPGFRAATLSGCRVAATRQGLWLHREAAKALPVDLRPGDSLHWDDRFQVVLGRPAARAGDTFTLGCLGPAGRLQGLDIARNVAILDLPAAAVAAFPALRDDEGLVAVPHLAYIRPNWPAKFLKKCLFAPQNRLS